jgi:hypothetical protein
MQNSTTCDTRMTRNRPIHANRAKHHRLGAVSGAVSFDEQLLRHLHLLCDAMASPPNWEVVLKADAADHSSMDWSRLQGLVRRALPAMADEAANRPVLLTAP